MRGSVIVGCSLLVAACGSAPAALEVEAPRGEALFDARSAPADAESIAEEGARDVIVELIPVFGRLGVQVEHRGDGVFRVANAAGERVELVERSDGESVILETGGTTFPIVDGDGDGERATLAMLSAIDRVLAAVGAQARAYARYFGGNEQIVVIMTPAERSEFDQAHPTSERLRGAD